MPREAALSVTSVRAHRLKLAGCEVSALVECTPPGAWDVPATAMRVNLGDLESLFGDAEVQVAVMAGPALRYVYVNRGYHGICPNAVMVGRTYREVFAEAAAAGAEARLHRAMESGHSWIVDDYPTPIPGRAAPIWWQGECVPIDLAGGGRADAILVAIWDVSHRHAAGAPPARSADRLRIDSARLRLATRMAFHDLTAARGWRVSEEVVETERATIWTLRPIHLRERAAVDLEESVKFERSPA